MKKKYVWIIAAWFLMVVFYLTDVHAILKGYVNGMCSSEQAQRMALLKKDKPEIEISIMQGFRREIGAF